MRHPNNPAAAPLPEREYVLGTDEAELQRLSFQHRLWSETASAHWRRAGIAPGMTVLDLGCGPGFVTRDLAQLLGPTGRVIAIDASQRYIDFVNRTPAPPGAAPIDARVGDAHDPDIPPASIDAAYSRWVFTFLPEPGRAIAGVARALKPGATFSIHDYHQWEEIFWGPANDTMASVRRAVLSSYKAAGSDTRIGQKLPGLMRDAGLLVRDIFPIQMIGRPGDALWQWPRTYFKSFLPRLVAGGHMTEGERLAVEREWDALERDPAAFFYTPPQTGIVAVKPGSARSIV